MLPSPINQHGIWLPYVKVDLKGVSRRWCSGKESACQCRRCKRCRFDPWVGKIPWSWKWQPIPVFLPGKFHGQRTLRGYSPWSHKELDMTEWLNNFLLGFLGWVVVKNLPANAGDKKDPGLMAESERFPGIGNGNPFQYSCLENSIDRGVWWSSIHGVTNSWTPRSD